MPRAIVMAAEAHARFSRVQPPFSFMTRREPIARQLTPLRKPLIDVENADVGHVSRYELSRKHHHYWPSKFQVTGWI